MKRVFLVLRTAGWVVGALGCWITDILVETERMSVECSDEGYVSHICHRLPDVSWFGCVVLLSILNIHYVNNILDLHAHPSHLSARTQDRKINKTWPSCQLPAERQNCLALKATPSTLWVAWQRGGSACQCLLNRAGWCQPLLTLPNKEILNEGSVQG